MHITVLGIDLGKNSCSVVGLDEAGRVVLRGRMRRDGVVRFAERLSPCTVAMEACCGAHHLGRELACFGHAPPDWWAGCAAGDAVEGRAGMVWRLEQMASHFRGEPRPNRQPQPDLSGPGAACAAIGS